MLEKVDKIDQKELLELIVKLLFTDLNNIPFLFVAGAKYKESEDDNAKNNLINNLRKIKLEEDHPYYNFVETIANKKHSAYSTIVDLNKLFKKCNEYNREHLFNPEHIMIDLSDGKMEGVRNTEIVTKYVTKFVPETVYVRKNGTDGPRFVTKGDEYYKDVPESFMNEYELATLQEEVTVPETTKHNFFSSQYGTYHQDNAEQKRNVHITSSDVGLPPTLPNLEPIIRYVDSRINAVPNVNFSKMTDRSRGNVINAFVYAMYILLREYGCSINKSDVFTQLTNDTECGDLEISNPMFVRALLEKDTQYICTMYNRIIKLAINEFLLFAGISQSAYNQYAISTLNTNADEQKMSNVIANKISFLSNSSNFDLKISLYKRYLETSCGLNMKYPVKTLTDFKQILLNFFVAYHFYSIFGIFESSRQKNRIAVAAAKVCSLFLNIKCEKGAKPTKYLQGQQKILSEQALQSINKFDNALKTCDLECSQLDFANCINTGDALNILSSGLLKVSCELLSRINAFKLNNDLKTDILTDVISNIVMIQRITEASLYLCFLSRIFDALKNISNYDKFKELLKTKNVFDLNQTQIEDNYSNALEKSICIIDFVNEQSIVESDSEEQSFGGHQKKEEQRSMEITTNKQDVTARYS